jgi:hydrogenase maturation protease
MNAKKKIIIYGLGNPYRCDDAVGIKIVEQLRTLLDDPRVTLRSGSIDGLTMLDEILGYDRVILVDAIKTQTGSPGDIYRTTLDPLDTASPVSLSHGISFVTAVRTGIRFGYDMPDRIELFAVEIADNESFSEECTASVELKIPVIVAIIKKETDEYLKQR